MVFVGNARQVGGIKGNGKKGFIQHVKEFLLRGSGKGKHIALDLFAGNVKGIGITAGHSRFLLYGGCNGVGGSFFGLL